MDKSFVLSGLYSVNISIMQPLGQPTMAQFIDAYMRPQASNSKIYTKAVWQDLGI